MFEIGNTLREARMRRGLDILDCESATKIRAKYLRAMEEEQFDLMPSPAYVRGFLRTYAEFLDLDGRLVLDEYESRFGSTPAPEEGRRGGGARRERPVGTGTVGARQGRPRRRSEAQLLWLAIGGVTGVALIVWMGIGGTDESPSSSDIPPAAGTAVRTADTPAETATTAAQATPASARKVAIAIEGAGDAGSWVEVRGKNAGGQVVYVGTLPPGDSREWRVNRSVWMRVGDPTGIEVTVDGEPQTLDGGTGDFIVSRSGARRVSTG